MRIKSPLPGIYKLEVPFENIYTAVFAVCEGNDFVLIDCATTADDVAVHILPALDKLGLTGAPRALLLTHTHGDHAGGATALHARFPEMPIYAAETPKDVPVLNIEDGDRLPCELQALLLPGHTKRSVGYLHLPTKAMISGDCLQQKGVDKYVNGIRFPQLYIESIQRLRSLPLQHLLASHDYVPLGAEAHGEAAIAAYLDECERDTPKSI